MACNLVAEFWVRQASPSTQLWTYVDNWELTDESPDRLVAAYRSLQGFCAEMDLTENVSKTFFWGTTPSMRKILHQEVGHLRSFARDLGSHVQYSRQATNQVIVQKISKFSERWGDLARPAAPRNQKLQSLRTVGLAQHFARCFQCSSRRSSYGPA